MKKVISIYLFALSLISNQSLFSQAEKVYSFPEHSRIILPQNPQNTFIKMKEQIHLHTSNTRVNAGESIWFKAYVTRGPEKLLDTPSSVLRLELLDESKNVVYQQYHRIEQGIVSGTLTIPKKIPVGKYSLRGYTRWMRNYKQSSYFMETIYVGKPEVQRATQLSTKPIEFSFFPEGGHLVSGVSNRVAIKAETLESVNRGFDGILRTTSGENIKKVHSLDQNIAIFDLIPEPDKTYELLLSDGSVHPLPKVQEQGYALRVSTINSDKLSIGVLASEQLKETSVTLKGEIFGRTYFEHLVSFTESNIAEVEIPTNGLPEGPYVLSLVDELGEKKAKRLIQISGNTNLNQMFLEWTDTSLEEGKKGIKIQLTDNNGNAIAQDFSISINPMENSGLRPEKTSSRVKRFREDLQTLTVSGEDTNWADIITSGKSSFVYPHQSGLELSGFAYDQENNLLPNAKIQIFGSSDSSMVVNEVISDHTGRVYLEDLQVVGETTFVFRTTTDQGKGQLVRIVPDKELKAKAKRSKKNVTSKIPKAPGRRKVIEPSNWQPIDSSETITLDEAILLSKKVKRKYNPSLYGLDAEPKNTVYQDPKKPRTFLELLQEIPGIIIRYTNLGDPSVLHIKSLGSLGGPPLWVLDGIPLTVSPFNLIASLDIERIEFIIGPNAAIFGTRANGGVFFVYTRSGSEFGNGSRKGFELRFQGYQPSLEFQEVHNPSRSKKKRSEFLPLYWNDALKTNVNGETYVVFDCPKGIEAIEIEILTRTTKWFAKDVYRSSVIGKLKKT